MKNNYLVFFVVAAILLNACSAGVNKDLLSGLKISNSGLSYKEAYLSRAQVKLNTSEYAVGDTVYLFMDGVEGYLEKDGKVNIGASISIISPDGKELMANPDLFPGDAGLVSKVDASVLSLHLIAGSPMVAGVKYLWKSKVWDKNGKGEINAEVEFTVK